MTHVARPFLRAGTALLTAAVAGCAAHTSHTSNVMSADVSGGHWEQYASAADAGFSPDSLVRARHYADSVRSGAVMIVRHGIVVAAWGDVARPLELHSVRKSIVSALYGIARDRGEVNLDRTLGDIGITDREPLTETERSARIRDLLAARSGVYLPAAYADEGDATSRPARDSHAPGTFWYYNNWDFNTLGVIYEKLVDSSLYKSIARRVAAPIGMEDYTDTSGFLVYEPGKSLIPAHTIRMSARDLARFGQLYLRRGEWNGRRVVPREWVEQSTSQISAASPVDGYGYLWWTSAIGTFGDRYPALNKRAMFYGRGTGGQLVLVIPSDDIVIVHRGDTDHGRGVAGKDVWRIVELALESMTASETANPARVPMHPTPFASQLPPLVAHYVPIDSALAADVAGRYEVTPGVDIRVYSAMGRLFGDFPGEGEAELFALSPSTFTVRVEAGVLITFERTNGVVTGLTAKIGSKTVHAVRR